MVFRCYYYCATMTTEIKKVGKQATNTTLLGTHYGNKKTPPAKKTYILFYYLIRAYLWYFCENKKNKFVCLKDGNKHRKIYIHAIKKIIYFPDKKKIK